MKKLSKDEMKMVVGGLEDNSPVSGNCQALVRGGLGDAVVIETLSPGEASGINDMIHWCCDSCCTASWAYHDNC